MYVITSNILNKVGNEIYMVKIFGDEKRIPTRMIFDECKQYPEDIRNNPLIIKENVLCDSVFCLINLP